MTPSSIPFPRLLQDFFQRRMVAERGASAHTIASYRDSFELLFATPSSAPDEHLQRSPCRISMRL